MTARVLLFGVGATKAGTSWLNQYLRDHPECHVDRDVEEAHFFDTLDGIYGSLQIDHLSRMLTRLQQEMKAATPEAAVNLLDRYESLTALQKAVLQKDTGRYLDWLHAGAGSARVVADITPAYGLLDARRYLSMSWLAEQVRFVFLLRDPAERLWSQAKIAAREQVRAPAEIRDKARHLFNAALSPDTTQVPYLRKRSDYQRMIANLSVLPRHALLTLFSEELFTEPGVRRLCAFLGIGFQPGAYERRINAGPEDTLADEDRYHARRVLAAQYDAAKAWMGWLPDSWTQERSKVA
jgi:hypothetical protein